MKDPFDHTPAGRYRKILGSSDDSLGSVAAAIGVIIVGFVVVRSLGLAYDGIASFLSGLAQGDGERLKIAVAIGASLGCFIAGISLFKLRKEKRKWYSFLEIGSAFGIAAEPWLRNPDTISTLTLLATSLGAVYVFVRGFDNLDTYKKELLEAEEDAIRRTSAIDTASPARKSSIV